MKMRGRAPSIDTLHSISLSMAAKIALLLAIHSAFLFIPAPNSIALPGDGELPEACEDRRPCAFIEGAEKRPRELHDDDDEMLHADGIELSARFVFEVCDDLMDDPVPAVIVGVVGRRKRFDHCPLHAVVIAERHTVGRHDRGPLPAAGGSWAGEVGIMVVHWAPPSEVIGLHSRPVRPRKTTPVHHFMS